MTLLINILAVIGALATILILVLVVTAAWIIWDEGQDIREID